METKNIPDISHIILKHSGPTRLSEQIRIHRNTVPQMQSVEYQDIGYLVLRGQLKDPEW